MSQLRDTINATGGGSNASRTDQRNPGQPSSVPTDISANDFFAHFDLPQEGDAFGAHHLFTTLGGGYQDGMERNASEQAVYTVKRAGLFTTDQRAPRPDEALPRTGREVRVGNGATGSALVSKEFDDLRMTDTNTMDDFRGLGKISALRLYAVKP